MKITIAIAVTFITIIVISLGVTGYFDNQLTLSRLEVKKAQLEVEKLELELVVYRDQASVSVD